MAETENGFLAIEVDADDYAETAAGDAPPVSRTYQSEEAFQAQRAAYSAKIDCGTTYKDLLAAVPILAHSNGHSHHQFDYASGTAKVRMSKKEIQLLGYAVGEMYYDRRYYEVIGLCDRVYALCEIDDKTCQSLRKWTTRCRERVS